ncbi:hypothetical protein [Phycicoccus sonneratiae]|uniref:Uncharacterized protein n=1 Tax=Phycicoccus sonneratiae TaxID=2807628 RepID=A0ABS2CHA5_9MICO|nr:hypothetical protein [Phycicoccus sonneraticus]MBM6399259.1 hypothetical protein [Phycicoccus sonneraticus]
MDTSRCPECGLIAEVLDRVVLESTDGPVEHAHVRCVARHRFWLPVAYLVAGGVAESSGAGARSRVEGWCTRAARS